VAFTVRIVSKPDIDALRKAFQKLLNNNESLRSTYYLNEGKPVQEVHGYKEVFFEEIDVKELNEEELKTKVIEVYKTPFDLEKGPVFKVHLFRVSDANFILLLKMHHICSDGWSIGIMLNELKQLYEDEINGNESVILNSQKYSDYINYQKELINSAEGEKLWLYWKNELCGEIPVLDLPADKPRPALQIFNGATEYFFLEKDIVDKLKKLSQSEGTTLFVTLLTAYQILLHRYSGQNEILIGTATAGRNKTDFEKIIGYFINPVVIRGKFYDKLSFKDFLNQIKKKVLGAIANQDFPYPLVVERLLKKRDPSRSPIFQAFFGLQKVPKGKEIQELVVPGNEGARVSWGKLELESFDIPQQEGQFDLMLEFFEGENIFTGLIKYNADVFNPDRIKRMCGQFQILLNSIINNPDKKISELEILSEIEKKKIINEWNDTEVDYDLNQTIESIFSEQAKKTPETVAVEFEDKKLTYKELDTITNQLGNLLVKNGVTKNTLVGVYIERSLEMIIALMGILKAHGAYVPIDPSYPNERIDYMIEDSGVKIILSIDALSENLSGHRAKIFNLDKDIDILSGESIEHPAINYDQKSLAYVIYTSGSTGKPKGAMNTNGGILNRLLWMKDYLKITPDDKIFQKTSFSFDVSVWEFFLPLISGAKLVFAKHDGHKDTKYLINEIINKNITHMHFVPSMLQVFLEDEEVSKCVSLKKVICSGEELTVSLQNLFFNRFKNAELYNFYGPTEAAVDVTYWKCDKESKLNVVPIGKPVANTQIYILDSNLNIVPVGVPGELQIGGIQVARGYHNRAELTLEKFIPDPFGKIENARLYKTGDLVRYLNDGNIEYLGRIDNQIKIRGFRIELGEIEFVLNQYDDVKEAVVIAKELKKGDKRLIAFAIPKRDKNVNSNDIRNYLKEKLPDYMVPSQIIFLNEMPLSQNGKVDRKALDNYEFTRDELQSEFRNASTSVEKKLVDIWQEVLSIDEIGINDNFFELGGDSILSIQIISKANQYGLRITPKQIFQYQTIAELSTVIDDSDTSASDQDVVTGDVYLTPIQKWFFNLNLPEPHHFNHSVLLKVPSDLNSELLKKTVEELVKHHDALRLRFKKENTEWKQSNAEFENAVLFDCEDLSNINKNGNAESIKASIDQLQTSLSLFNGPLIRVRLFKLGTKEDKMIIIINHLCVDGISWRILLEDFYNVYFHLNRGEKILLPAKTTSFKEWSKRLSQYSNSEKLSSEYDYWLSIAHSNFNSIPKDSAEDNNNTVESSDTVSLIIEEQMTESILQEVPKVYNTKINDVLLTALILAYKKWSDENRLLINLEGHGREELFENIDVSRTIGWFTSIFPIKLEAENPEDIGGSLKSVKEKMRQIPNNGIGFGLLKYLNNDENINEKLHFDHQPEIIFNYLGQITGQVSAASDWKLGKGTIKLSQNKNGIRSHLIEINSLIIENKIRMEFVYSKNIHNKETIEQFSKYYEEALISIIEHCKSPEAGGYTPSDFSAADLNQQELDNLLANLN